MSVTFDLGVRPGWGVTVTLMPLQEPGFHRGDKASTCNNKWQTSAMFSDMKSTPQTGGQTEDSAAVKR